MLIVKNKRLGFSSAHITLEDGDWRLHGHNFEVEVHLDLKYRRCGVELYEDIKGIVNRFDHKVILNDDELKTSNGNSIVEKGGELFSFPNEDVLAIPATTDTFQIGCELFKLLSQEFPIQRLIISADELYWHEISSNDL